MQLLEKVHPGRPIDCCVVGFGQHRKAVRGHFGNIVQTLDDIELPQRLGHIQWAGKNTRYGFHQSAAVARLWKRDATYVVFQVEIGIFDPVGIVCFEWYASQASPHGRIEMQAFANRAGYGFLGQLLRGGACSVVDAQGANVHRRRWRF